MCSHVEKWEKDDMPKKIMGCKKYRFLPSAEQQKILNEWIGTARYTYNKTIHKIENEKQKVNFFNLRNNLVPKHKIHDKNKWILNTPKEIRAYSVKEAVTSFKSAFTNLKNKSINKFKIQFKSKKKLNEENITIPKTAIKTLNSGSEIKIYSRSIHQSIKLKKEKIESIEHDIKLIHLKRCNLWYLCIPIEYKFDELSESQGNSKEIVSIDPGIKTFLTLYDPKGKVIKIGKDDMKKILAPLYLKIDKLKSIKSKSNKKKKYNLHTRIHKLIYKFKNYINEIHNKASQYIVSNYKIILIPQLSKIKMQGSKNRRNLLSWSHGRFITRLIHCSHKKNCVIKIVTEEYTSKTCGNCGKINESLKNKDIYKCDNCNLIIDRDTNGARNILLKCL